jgi:phage-related protein
MSTVASRREITIYQGECFSVEWYFTSGGKCEAFEFYISLSEAQRRKFLILVKRMGDAGKIFDESKFRNEGDKLYCFKPHPDRFLCFFTHWKKLIVTNGFRKKSQRLPKKEKEKA